jgi:hypothetical protein
LEVNVKSNAELIIGIAVLTLGCLTVFGVYQWLQIKRQRLVATWVRDYLKHRLAEMPNDLHIHCTNDRLWPFLVDYEAPHSKTRHSLQFICPGPHSTFALLSEKEDRLETSSNSRRSEPVQRIEGAAQ